MRFEIGKIVLEMLGFLKRRHEETSLHESSRNAEAAGGSDPEMWSGLGVGVPSPRWRNPDESMAARSKRECEIGGASSSSCSPQQMIRSVEQLSWCAQVVVRLR
jgi:hypothetical protein